jgi:hypothetical protein
MFSYLHPTVSSKIVIYSGIKSSFIFANKSPEIMSRQPSFISVYDMVTNSSKGK